MKQSAHHLATSEQPLDGPPVGADDTGIFVNFQGTKGEGHAAGGGVSQEGWLFEARGPVALFRAQTVGRQAVLLAGVKDGIGV